MGTAVGSVGVRDAVVHLLYASWRFFPRWKRSSRHMNLLNHRNVGVVTRFARDQ